MSPEEKAIDYYERLLDYLGDHVPCLCELISHFDDGEKDGTTD